MTRLGTAAYFRNNNIPEFHHYEHVKDLGEELKNLNDHDSEIAKDFHDFLKDTKHAMLTLAKTVQELADLEEETKNARKGTQERNKNLETGLKKAGNSYLSESQKVIKWKNDLPGFLNRVIKVWERVDGSVKGIKIKMAE